MLNEASSDSLKYTRQLISDDQRETILVVNLVILGGVVSLLGSVANVINMAVYYRQGLDTTTNISFFSLAISGMCSLVFQQFYNLFVNPFFVSLNLPIVYTDVQFLTVAVPREIFAQIACLITVFITAERYLCVVFPLHIACLITAFITAERYMCVVFSLHIKRLITPKLTATVMVGIYTFTFITGLSLFFTMYYTWKFNPDSNRTLLCLAFTSNHAALEGVIFFMHAMAILLGFLSVLTFTLILIYKLRQKHEWRQTVNIDHKKSKQMSKRDRATMTMVVLIAGILVVCYTPRVFVCLTTFLVPDFSVTGSHYNVYHSLWSLAMLLEVINSSVNIFLYYKTSSKYRRTYNQLFSFCLCSEKPEVQ